MKNFKDVNIGDASSSKGYGFVNFYDPQHAIKALRAINNNPEIFSSKRVFIGVIMI